MKSYVFSHSNPGERGGVTFVNESPKSLLENLRKRLEKTSGYGRGELARDLLKAT